MPRHALIAVGAAALAAAVGIAEIRMDQPWATGVLFGVAAVAAAVLLAVGLRERPLADRPHAESSGLLLAGLAVFAIADYRLLQLLGSDDALDAPRSLTAFFAILTAMALFAAFRSRSAACLLVGAIALGGTVLAGVRWIFDTENVASYRPVLLLLAVGFAAAAWAVRERRRHRDVLVDAAGLALFGLLYVAGSVLVFGVGGSMPDAWEVVVFAGIAALVGYTALTRAPGPGLIALLLLVAFVTAVGYDITYEAVDTIDGSEDRQDASLVGWPLVLLVLGAGALAYGLTRRRDDDHGHRDHVPPPPPEDPTDVSREVRV